ncbi:DUF4935 domain-containing protein [Agrobacterium tumefaciens]|nr:DUF4935 domain-containing protein [Agrobacterium tumefaciens]NTE21474.1 DUF4935 domain-containing protein [Agrobacterium tumefaciens]
MKNTFLEFNALDKDEIKALWNGATFVFDANVLLNLYRYSDETSQKFLQLISDLGTRSWLPFQVGLEFHKNRLTVISEQRKHFVDFQKKFEDLINEIENRNKNPFFSKSVCNDLDKIKLNINKEVETKASKFDDLLNSDSIVSKLNKAFDGRVGKRFEEAELKVIYLEGEKRYKEKIPPGYKDSAKPDYEKFGDLLVWKEIIKKAKDSQMDVIFISDDGKEDWWLKHSGKTISARPELLREFKDDVGKNCHFYKPFQFLEFSNEYLGKSVKSEVIEEVKNHITPSSNSGYLLVEVNLTGSKEDVDAFVNDIRSAGYNIYLQYRDVETIGQSSLFISLPDIPDLFRRLQSKYLFKADLYNLKDVVILTGKSDHLPI